MSSDLENLRQALELRELRKAAQTEAHAARIQALEAHNSPVMWSSDMHKLNQAESDVHSNTLARLLARFNPTKRI